MKALILGSNGQDGFYLNKLLSEYNIDVITVSRKNALFIGDISNLDFISKIIEENKPEYIFHLAANSSTRHNLLFENHATIETGTLNVLESSRIHSPESNIFISGSAMQFKNTGKPIDENTPFEASSPYSLSRIQSTYAARYYRDKFGLKVFVGYFFNHDSPLRSESHVNQKIVKAVQRIHQGVNEELTLGNIDVRKEFNFAGDIVEAIWKLVNQETIFEVVIGSGEAYSIKEWVEYCFSLKGLDWRKYVKVENNFIPEYSTLVCNPTLLKSIGWQPKTTIFELAKIMMDNE